MPTPTIPTHFLPENNPDNSNPDLILTPTIPNNQCRGLCSTLRFTDSGKLNLLRWFDFRLEPTFATAPDASKSEAFRKNCSKMTQK